MQRKLAGAATGYLTGQGSIKPDPGQPEGSKDWLADGGPWPGPAAGCTPCPEVSASEAQHQASALASNAGQLCWRQAEIALVSLGWQRYVLSPIS